MLLPAGRVALGSGGAGPGIFARPSLWRWGRGRGEAFRVGFGGWVGRGFGAGLAPAWGDLGV